MTQPEVEKSEGAQLEVTEPTRSTARHVRHDHIPTDLDDPHRAALEENPEHAERLTLTTILAVIVSQQSCQPCVRFKQNVNRA